MVESTLRADTQPDTYLMKFRFYSTVAVAVVGMSQMAQSAVLALSDEISIIGDNAVAPFGDPLNFGTAGPANGASFRYTARERDNPGQLTRRVATFLEFDTSALTVAEVNAPGFSATFEIEHVGHLNAVNNGMDLYLGRNNSGAWESGVTNPQFAWGLASADQTLLLANVMNFPNSEPLSADITSIVQGWVNGTFPNQGLALFGIDNGGNASNASYLINPSVTTSAIPEPSSLALASLGLFGLLARRRR